MGLFEALSYPQRKLKKAVSGDEAEWFSPDNMPPWAYAAGNTALDLVADPLNFIPVGLLGKAAKALPYGKKALRGAGVTSAPNYIPNHYGPTDPSRFGPAGAKVEGLAKWAGESAKNVSDSMLTPSGRALYGSTGINKGTQATVARHLKKGDTRKAAAQVNYNKHGNVQAAREGTTAPALDEIARHSNLETYQPLQNDTISNMMKKHSGTKSTRGSKASEAIDMSDTEARYIEDHVLTSWGKTDDVVMKRARSGTGGDHFNDFTKKSPMSSVAYNIFKKYKGNPTLRQMYDEALKLEKKQPFAHDFRIKNKDWDDVQKNGLWFKGGMPGSAVTEGGINWLGKLEPNGNMLGIISDKHDFLDKGAALAAKGLNKIPGMKVSPDITKRSLLAVTPPMRANIKSIKSKQLGGADELLSGVERVKRKGEATQGQLLQDYVSARPSAEALKGERIRQAGLLSGGAALYQGREDVQ